MFVCRAHSRDVGSARRCDSRGIATPRALNARLREHRACRAHAPPRSDWSGPAASELAHAIRQADLRPTCEDSRRQRRGEICVVATPHMCSRIVYLCTALPPTSHPASPLSVVQLAGPDAMHQHYASHCATAGSVTGSMSDQQAWHPSSHPDGKHIYKCILGAQGRDWEERG